MSTGTSVPIADPAPPHDEHAHSHGRTRGHNRSRQWAQPPPSLSFGDSNGSPTKLAWSSQALNTTQNHNIRDPSSSSYHNHSLSQVTSHHNHSHSVASIYHDALHDHDVKEELAASSQPGPEKINELLTGAIIASPWVAISWYLRKCPQLNHTGINSDTDQEDVALELTSNVGRTTCILTALTLLLYGCGQFVRLHQQRNSSSVKVPTPNVKTAQTAILQTLSVGLPIYAALEVGGFLVSFSLLLGMASGVPKMMDEGSASVVKEKFSRKVFTIALLAVTTLLGFFGMNHAWCSRPFTGYLALMLSVFALPSPFPNLRWEGPIPEPGLVAQSMSQHGKASDANQSSVAVTIDAPLALISGGTLASINLIVSRGSLFSISELLYVFIFTGLFATSLMISSPSKLRSPDKIGLAAITGAAALLCSPDIQDEYVLAYTARGILTAMSFVASRMDDSHLRADGHAHNHSHRRRHSHSHSRSIAHSSAVTKWLIHHSEAYPLLNSILKERDSRSIFYFMCLNFAFMLIQLFYGVLTGSLGLLSDSIHMFFDCLALVVGLCAAVMSKWPPSAQFPYGYGKVDTLSGFANGIFLMIISLEIVYEAVERLSSGSQMHRLGELLAVSVAGLVVNLVGIFSFEHGHHHGHDHGHDHAHGNENMHGIFLHILADTLGSVAVVISTILVHYSGWSGYDPLASCLIAILIFASAVPLVSSTAKTLLLALPADLEYNVRETLAGVSTLRGVVGYTVPKFWLDDTGSSSESHNHGHDHSADGSCNGHHDHSPHNDHDHDHDHIHEHDHTHDHAHEHKKQRVYGVIHVIASRGSDLEDVRQRTSNYLQEKDMDIVVQVERDGDGRCWCGGGGNKGS